MNDNSKKVSAFCDDMLGTLDGVALAELITKGEIKTSEAVEAAIARAEKVNPIINAIVTETFNEARNQAKMPNSGLFSGVPTFVKDLDRVKGAPTLWGSGAVPPKPAKKNSKFVKQYLSTGVIILGKSSLPEFGLLPTTEPVAFGATRNPWHIDHSTGGSSGGSAALVASGVVPIAQGNDGGGSIRIPAACCGLVGLKPSRNRLKNMEYTQVMPVTSQGVLTRSVRDTAVFYASAEKYYKNPRLPEIGLIENPVKKRLKIGVLNFDTTVFTCDSPTNETLTAAAKRCEALGHKTEEIKLSDYYFFQNTEKWQKYDLILYSMICFALHELGVFAFGLKFNRKKLEESTRTLSIHFRKALFRNLFEIFFVIVFTYNFYKDAKQFENEIFSRYDILLSPVVTQEPVKLGYFTEDSNIDVFIEKLGNYMPITPIQNITGAPAISLPLGQSPQGLPIGVQFAAPYGHEKELIELAFELEQASPWRTLFS